jgi:hypothetical protein
MEAKFAWLEAKIINMVAQMKSIVFRSGKTKDQENG